MKRRAFNLMTALSLLLCVAVGWLWAWGGILYVGHRPQWHAAAQNGRLVVQPADGSGHPLSVRMPAPSAMLFCLVVPTLWLPRRQGRGDARPAGTGHPWLRRSVLPVSYVTVALQIWGESLQWRTTVIFLLWIPFAALVLPLVRREIADRRRRTAESNGLCASCGYDLRATPERCPECGAGVAGVARAGGERQVGQVPR